MADSDSRLAAGDASVGATEKYRLDALAQYNILDTAAEASFDALTRIAAYVCEVPIALVSFVDEQRQWFKSEYGLGVRETPIGSSICAHAIQQPDLFIVPDASKDPRFMTNPLVTGAPHIRFYAGVVLETLEGLRLGTLCVIDSTPRTLSTEQEEILRTLARQAMTQLELRRAVTAAALSNRYRSRLMAVAGHDLKQPLQTIIMSLGLLQMRHADADSQQHAQTGINAAFTLGKGLDELASASALGQDGDSRTLSVFAVSTLIDRIAETWRDHAARKGIELRVVPSSVNIRSNERLLATILGNLVGNAIKYTTQGSVVIGCRRHGSWLSIQVIDTGCGIAASQSDIIFEPFSQLDSSVEGVGLGLSIVRQTAELLGHAIRINSRVGHGSIFSIDVPTASPQ